MKQGNYKAGLRRRALAITLAMMFVGLGERSLLFAQAPTSPLQLKERPVLAKPQQTVLNDQVRPDVIVVKFREGTHLRWRTGQWTVDLGNLSAEEQRRLQRVNLDRGQMLRDLESLNTFVQNNSQLRVERLFTRPEDELDREKLEGELNSQEELADLNLYYHLFIDNAQPSETEVLINQLNALDIVEIAYAQPLYYLPQQDIPPTTPNYEGNQGYLNAAAVTTPGSNGIDARYAWTLPGGRGDNLQIIDIEYDFLANHEDLPAVFHNSGVRTGLQRDIDHGTAVLGMLAAGDNGYGTTGIVARSRIGVASPHRACAPPPCQPIYDVADAVNRASGALAVGEIILIEQQVGGPTQGVTCNPNCSLCPPDPNSQFGLIPVEWNQAEFDAIRAATLNGRIVIEAAGNGMMNLDDARYNRRFDRVFRDSFAIIVGAGASNSRAPQCWSNAGSRVDVQGWGDSVFTLGYGVIRENGPDQRQWYTNGFGGTSSASPIVTGAAAAVQSVRRMRGLTLLTSFQMRDLLRSTGVAQAAGRAIGPLPNLRDAIALYVSTNAPFFQNGTPQQPFGTVDRALGAAWDQAQIRIRPGSYPEQLTITNRVFLMSTGGTVTIGR